MIEETFKEKVPYQNKAKYYRASLTNGIKKNRSYLGSKTQDKEFMQNFSQDFHLQAISW